jgi:hypothetical protein
MNMEKIKAFIQLAQELETEGMYGFHNQEMHVSREVIQRMNNLQIKVRHSENYPFEISTKVDGIKIFALAGPEELKEFPQFQNIRKEAIRKQIEALEVELNQGEEASA